MFSCDWSVIRICHWLLFLSRLIVIFVNSKCPTYHTIPEHWYWLLCFCQPSEELLSPPKCPLPGFHLSILTDNLVKVWSALSYLSWLGQDRCFQKESGLMVLGVTVYSPQKSLPCCLISVIAMFPLLPHKALRVKFFLQFGEFITMPPDFVQHFLIPVRVNYKPSTHSPLFLS